ncbi:1,2-epoxyphenylacetyl-CoA isomerase [BD1-7 clade bacterium]|uniref:1,2-epoxyphenylacetyl-CoA isomerase n=1 Tax=BD1-7 clade bacterium TaxID=2029982 RepID=A0A5S9QB41_9GAMM|nr:1,2-epoxyphenylacetyl-CoA isomerase [BD1-7 clade bacterium]CAA0119022.1 1,2-epoxyphenylacetyl-CoA isomerase [BD1-7 clade bacterium]
MSDFETLEFSIENQVAIIKLNRPEAANGINLQMAQELMQAAIDCDENPAIRAVLLTGNGKMFSAGGDLKSFAAFGDQVAAKIKELMVYMHSSISRFSRLQKPVVIAVNGMAAGAGFSIAATGDLVYAAASAKFTMAYTAAGLSPDGSASFFLPRLIGMRRTQELMLTNRRLSAEEAKDWGVLTDVVEDDKLYETALAQATKLANGPTLAFGTVKKLLMTSFQESLETQMEHEAQGMGTMAGTIDGKEGISAFVEKRKPEYKGL